jgi:TolA-binding protein
MTDDATEIDFQNEIKIEDRQDLKKKIADLEKQIDSLNKKIAVLSKKNDKLNLELEKVKNTKEVEVRVETIKEVLATSRDYVMLDGTEYKVLEVKTVKDLEIAFKKRFHEERQFFFVVTSKSPIDSFGVRAL